MAVAFGARSNLSMRARKGLGASPPKWGPGAKPKKLRGTWQQLVFVVFLDVDGGGGSGLETSQGGRGGAGSRFCKRDWHGSKADKKQGCPKGPPPDAVHMSRKLVGPEPVQNTQKLPAAADTQDEARQSQVTRPNTSRE